jgi:type IV secretory pathway component VirB8
MPPMSLRFLLQRLTNTTALYVGTVPIYLGAPNVDIFTPTYGTDLKSIINIADFNSTRDLVDFVIALGNDENRYNEYLEWKNRPLTQHFTEIMRYSFKSPNVACKICEHMYHIKTNQHT